MDARLKEAANPPRGRSYRTASAGRVSGVATRASGLIVALAFALPMGMTRPGAAAGPPQTTPRVLADFPLGKGDSPWIVRVAIRYNEYQMIVDTGCSGTAFDIAHRGALGKVIGTVNMNSANGLPPLKGLERLRAPILEIGELKVRPRAGVLCIDLGFLTKWAGTKIDGILGMDVLRQLVLNVDPDEGHLRFYGEADPEDGTPVPIVWENRENPYEIPSVEVAFADGMPRRFVIDAGMNAGPAASSGSLNPKTYDQLVSRHVLLSLPVATGKTVYTLGGSRVIDKWAKLQRMSLGGNGHEGLIFSCGSTPNCLGLGYLSRYCITFDFPRDTIYLRPSKEFGRTDFYDLSGMRFVTQDGVAAVTWILKDAPAAAAGLAVGDSITAIDGQNVPDVSEATIHEILSKEGQHSIEFRREDVSNRVVLAIGPETATSATAERPSPLPK